MSTTPKGLTSFKIFPNLPYELRCMIWKATCSPRVVEIEYDEEDGFRAKNFDPLALRVCKESRKLIEQSYPLCFGSIFHPAKTRFNFAIDTLYIGNEIDEYVPHFFSTFGPLEISSLRVLALEDCYNETTLPFETTLTRQLQKMVTNFPALREILIVYDVAAMTDRTLHCSVGHALELHNELPPELKHPSVMIDPLPKEEDAEAHGYKLWGVGKVRPVYGWRRCPGGASWEDLDLDYDEDNMSDEESFGLYGPWGGPPPPLAMGLARMFGGPMDSDEEDDMYGLEDEYDEDDEDLTDEHDEDVEEDGDGALRVESVD